MRRFIAVLSALALVGLVATPVMAAKPITLKFSTDLLDGYWGGDIQPVELAGSPSKGFVLPTGGVAGVIHQLYTDNVRANPGLAGGQYPFYLQASPDQQAALTAYFTAKGLPQAVLDQSALEIAGTAPYFVLVYPLGPGYWLEDGFHNALPIEPPMYAVQIEDDYPTGTYTYTGTLIGTNGATLNYTIVLTVVRA